jgi:hypothetical protein
MALPPRGFRPRVPATPGASFSPSPPAEIPAPKGRDDLFPSSDADNPGSDGDLFIRAKRSLREIEDNPGLHPLLPDTNG